MRNFDIMIGTNFCEGPNDEILCPVYIMYHKELEGERKIRMIVEPTPYLKRYCVFLISIPGGE